MKRSVAVCVLGVAAVLAAGCAESRVVGEGDVPVAPPGERAAAPGGAAATVRRAGGVSVSRQFKDHRSRSTAWSPDGRRLAVARGSSSGGTAILDVVSGKEIEAARPKDGEAAAVAWSPDGKTLAAVRPGHPILRILDAASGADVAVHEKSGPHPELVAFAPDGATVVFNGAGGGLAIVAGDPEGPNLHVADARTAETLRTIRTGVGCVTGFSHSPDGLGLAVLEETVTLRDPLTGAVRWTSAARGALLAWSAGSRWIVALEDSELVLLDPADGREAGRFLVDDSTRVADSGRIEKGVQLRAMAVSPTEFIAATGRRDGRVELWDLRTGRRLARDQLRTAEGHAVDSVEALAFAPDGRRLAASTRWGLFILDLHHAAAPAGTPLGADGVQSAWQALLSDDAREARRGAAWLSGDPEGALPRIALLLGAPAPAGALEAVLADLAADDPAVRQRGTVNALRHPALAPRLLAEAAAAADPDLAAALRDAVAAMERSAGASAELRARDRALLVLELAGTDAARAQLERFAAQAPLERERREAAAAARRMGIR